MLLHAINLLVHRRLTEDIARYRREVELIVVPPPFPVEVQPMDFGQAKSLIDRAVSVSRQFLDELGAPSPPHTRDRDAGATNGRRASAVCDPPPRWRGGGHVGPNRRADASKRTRAKTATAPWR
jgi:hypothetical protein